MPIPDAPHPTIRELYAGTASATAASSPPLTPRVQVHASESSMSRAGHQRPCRIVRMLIDSQNGVRRASHRVSSSRSSLSLLSCSAFSLAMQTSGKPPPEKTYPRASSALRSPGRPAGKACAASHRATVKRKGSRASVGAIGFCEEGASTVGGRMQGVAGRPSRSAAGPRPGAVAISDRLRRASPSVQDLNTCRLWFRVLDTR
jgi:hypothetical protein